VSPTVHRLDIIGRCDGVKQAAALLKAKRFTIDGEAVVIGPEGLTDFEALRSRGARDVAVLYAFDLIELDGSDLRNLPIETRKGTLASLLRKPGALRLSEHISAEGPQVFVHACRLGAEGIVSNRLGSTYRSGPCHAWVKCKNPKAVAAQRDSAAGWNR
jgi:bifunctional non-homologous end joining protein LigD